MYYPMRLQLLICLVVYVSSVHAIKVKFGTKDGPIVPPTPEPVLPVPQPYRIPAPVWEERSNDTPDPNAQWRPQLFVPQPRYTQIIYNVPVSPPQPLTNAQRFVNSYIPNRKHEPIAAEPVTNYLTPNQILSSQSLPGFGIRYFVPTYIQGSQEKKNDLRQEDAIHNEIGSNNVNGVIRDDGSDLQWKYEKEASKRISRHIAEGAAVPYIYQWPAYVPPRDQ